jgi:hypothetical protein
MEKKTIFLELPAEMINIIDRQNVMGDRSVFVSALLQKQLEKEFDSIDMSTDLMTRIDETSDSIGVSGEIGVVNSKGILLGKFNINSVEGFEKLSEKISELSEDPIVRMRVKRWL